MHCKILEVQDVLVETSLSHFESFNLSVGFIGIGKIGEIFFEFSFDNLPDVVSEWDVLTTFTYIVDPSRDLVSPC